MNPYQEMDREQLLAALAIFAKNWLAHDGCWFLAAEAELGMETAIRLDAAAWGRFAAAEARRILDGFDLPRGGGLDALEHALSLRMYALINEQHAEWSADRSTLRFRHGRLPRPGDAASQGSRRLSVLERRHRRVHRLRANHRPQDPDPLPPLPT